MHSRPGVYCPPASTPLPCLAIRLGRTKTTDPDDDARSLMIGRPVDALRHWLQEARIDSGPVFRRIDKRGNVDRRALSPQSINLILNSRCTKAGLDPQKFSAHGLRSGYLPEAANRGVPLPEAMQHPSTGRGPRRPPTTIIPTASAAGRRG